MLTDPLLRPVLTLTGQVKFIQRGSAGMEIYMEELKDGSQFGGFLVPDVQADAQQQQRQVRCISEHATLPPCSPSNCSCPIWDRTPGGHANAPLAIGLLAEVEMHLFICAGPGVCIEYRQSKVG